MTTTTYPTRRPREGHRPPTVGDSWYGERDGRRLCELDVSWESGWMSGAPNRDDLPDEHPVLCANVADVVWVGSKGSLTWTCSGHVPHPDDEQLKPKQADQLSRWEMIEYTAVHSLTGLQPVALEGCTTDVLTRAIAVAARLAEYDHLPKTFDISDGWMGSSEDEARLEAAGEKTNFQHIPEGLREDFGGAETIMEFFDGADRQGDED